jgi:ribulose-phosphate 3-epimerase
MSVEPGFGGQSFRSECLDKVRRLRERAGADLLLSIDGGIGLETIGAAAAAGAELFVVGSAIFDGPDYAAALASLRAAATTAGRPRDL